MFAATRRKQSLKNVTKKKTTFPLYPILNNNNGR